MVSAWVCFKGKGPVHFVEEKAKVNAGYYVQDVLPKLLEDYHDLMDGWQLIFQQDGAPTHEAKVTQKWLGDKDSWSPNSPDLNFPWLPHVGAMLEKFNELNRNRRTYGNGAENGAADYQERSVWWNNSQICSEL